MSEDRPYLDVDGRVAYLVSHGYVEDDELSDAAAAFLARTNFHYFLGYARNFRKLRREGRVEGDLSLDRAIQMVRLDHQVSDRLFQALRALEWRLRAALVDAHCRLYPATSCFLDPGHYSVRSFDARPVEESIREQIARSREPFVLGTFEAHEKANGRAWKDSAMKMADGDRLEAMRSLPIWAVVDGWSLGLLERVINQTAPQEVEGSEQWLWKEVAGRFSVANQVFETQLKSLIVLRNLIAHHSRLWMRPTASSSRSPKAYSKQGRGVDPKAMYVTWLTLASFLRESGHDKQLLDDLDGLIGTDPLYELGIKNPLHSAA